MQNNEFSHLRTSICRR